MLRGEEEGEKVHTRLAQDGRLLLLCLLVLWKNLQQTHCRPDRDFIPYMRAGDIYSPPAPPTKSCTLENEQGESGYKATSHASDPPFSLCPLPNLNYRLRPLPPLPLPLPSPKRSVLQTLTLHPPSFLSPPPTPLPPSLLPLNPIPPSLFPLHPPSSLSLQGLYSSPSSGFCAISSRLWGSHCIDASRLRASSSPPSPSTLPDSATSLGPCSTRAKHVR